MTKPRTLAAALAYQSARHTYEVHAGRIVVREPAIADGCIVCTLHGDTAHGIVATSRQAEAICAALDRLARKEGVR